MPNIDKIFFVIATILSFTLNIFILFRLQVLYAIVHDKLLNEVKARLTQAMQEELADIGTETVQEQVLWRYFRKKRDYIYSRYIEIKEHGLNHINNYYFRKDLRQSGRLDLNGVDWPESFLQRIDDINAQSWAHFKNNFTSDIITANKKEQITVLQNNVVNTFRTNVKLTFRLYLEFRKEAMSKSAFTIVRDEVQTGRGMRFSNIVSIDKMQLKQLISQGMSGMSEAIGLLQLMFDPAEKQYDEILHLSGRIANLNKAERTGTGLTNETDKAVLMKSFLDLIDILK